MTIEEIEKAAKEEYLSNPDYSVKELVNTFVAGAKFANQHLQEKTRWKSLITEPPYDCGKSYFLRMGLNGEPRTMPFLNKNSIDDYIDYGFTEWKEIE